MPYRKFAPKKKYGAKWYVDGSLPSVNTPFGKVGGGGFRVGNGKYGAKSLTSIIKAKSRLDEPVKYKSTAQNDIPMQAQTIYTLNPLGNIPIGTGDLSRLSSDIFVRGIKVRGIFSGPANTGTAGAINSANKPCHIRMAWVRTNVSVAQTSDLFVGTGLALSDIFRQGNNHPISAQFDTDKVTVLSDTTLTVPGSTITGVQQSKTFEFDCPLQNFPFRYNSPTSNYSSVNKNIYCIVMPFSVGDTPSTTINTVMVQSWSVIFSDSR